MILCEERAGVSHWGRALALATRRDSVRVQRLLPVSSLVVQWLGLCAFTAEVLGLISGWGTKISQAMWPNQKKKNLLL